MLDSRGHGWDANLQLASSNTLATSSYATYGAATPKTIDLGGDGFTKGNLVIDVSAVGDAMVQASGTVYDFILRGSNESVTAASFDSGYVALARFRLGVSFAAESIKDAGNKAIATASAGRYVIPWTNRFKDTCYRYLRLRLIMGGTFTTGITYSAFLTK